MATREENLKKINTELEKMSDEQLEYLKKSDEEILNDKELDAVLGGTIGHVDHGK